MAGVVDSPLPAPFTKHVFTVPGVIDSNLGTFFSCTNLDAANVTVGVELFAQFGGGPVNDVVATSLTLGAGETRTFATGSSANIVIDSALGAGSFSKGSARILSTSKKIACTAYVADRLNSPPTSGWQLTIIAKTKQKAAN
jgi:hypothetical protein